MTRSRLSYFVVHQRSSPTARTVSHSSSTRSFWPPSVMLFALLSLFLVSCSGLNLGGGKGNGTPGSGPTSPGSSPNSTVAQVALAQIHWCGKPLMIFRDEGAPTQSSPSAITTTGETPGVTATATATAGTTKPTTLTSWSQVKAALGFTVYLPQTLPQNACLVSASGTVHDPIFGGSFTIGYLLADHSSISLAEAPFRSQNRHFQCTPSSGTGSPGGTDAGTPAATIAGMQICSGVQGNTSIVFSARGSTDALQQFFNALQPNIDWVPA